MLPSDSLSEKQREELMPLVTGLNEKLESTVQNSTNHAFNVGCSVTLIPLALIVGLVFFLSKFNWIITLVALVFCLIAALGLAALVASFARNNSADKTYQLHIAPEIERNLVTHKLTRPEFDRVADDVLPQGAMLRNYLERSPQ